MTFEAHPTDIAELTVLTRNVLQDQRGSFSRLFCQNELQDFGWDEAVVQSNMSTNKNVGTIRGMHFQRAPYQEMKLVTCVSGCVFDVAIDMRPNSETFGKWYGTELSSDNGKSLLIPKGFAHGFQVLQPNSALIYYHSAAYAPEVESGVRWDDKDLNIHWPLPPRDISLRDNELPSFATHQKGDI